MPAADVSDLKDVFDAINRLCETMKTSAYVDDDAFQFAECGDGPVRPGEADGSPRAPEDDAGRERASLRVGASEPTEWADRASRFVSAEDLSIQRMETQRQKWKESQASLASSELSGQREAAAEEQWSDAPTSPPRGAEPAALDGDVSPPERDADAECVLAGHVAAMRERFESMTRANTPCPDAAPALDLCRNVTPSPDLLR